MTNFEYYTATPARLDELLYGAVDDALFHAVRTMERMKRKGASERRKT